MKQQSIALNPDPPDGPPEINWSNCCLCDTGGYLLSTDAGIESPPKQFVAWWKHDILPFNASRLSNSDIVVNGRVFYPNFENLMKASIAKYHHNCKSNFCDYKLKKK